MKLIKWTLRKNFFIPTLTLIVLGMGISTIVSYVRTRTMMNESAIDQMTQMSAMATKNIGFWIENRKIEVGNWATEQIFAEALSGSDLGRETRLIVNEQFEAFKKNAPYYEVIALSNKKGELVASTNKDIMVGKLNVAEYLVFKQALADDRFPISAQVALDKTFTDAREEGWTESDMRLQMVRRWSTLQLDPQDQEIVGRGEDTYSRPPVSDR